MTQESKQINNEESASSDFAKKLADLRDQLQRNELEWPETADSLIADIALLNIDISASSQDFEMLSLVVDAVLRGDDIARAYPKFYKRMLVHADLQQAFFDILETAMHDQESEPLPVFPPPNLDFLQQQDISSPPIITHHLLHGWQAVWRVMRASLDHQFILPLVAYRSGISVLDEDSTLLLHNEFEIETSSWRVTLEAVSLPNDPNQLSLFLSVTTDQDPFPSLQATLRWGNFQETAVLDPYGRTRFSSLPFAELIDETGQAFRTDLHLALESHIES